LRVGLDLDFVAVHFGKFNILSVFCVNLNHRIAVLLAFVVFGLVSSVSGQEIGWENLLRNNLSCVKWDIKPLLNQSRV